MKRKSLWLISITILLLFATVACDISFGKKAEGPTEEEIALELTRISIEKTQTAVAEASPEPEESPSPESTQEDEETEEDEDTSSEDCYFSRWTGDETIPDGTKFDPGDSFDKSWTVRNEGTCTWGTDFYLEFEDGDQMDGPDKVYLTESVSPNETYDLEVSLVAPSSDGEYTGVWRLKAADGTEMGYYWVKIIVGDVEPEDIFKVSSVNYSGYDAVVDIVCPSNTVVNITANITTNKAGLVSFKWDDSQGCAGCATKSINFNAAGTKSVTHSMTIPAGGDYWARIYIDTPNHQWFHKAEFEAHCNP